MAENNAGTGIHPRIASRDVTLHILKTFRLKASKRFGQNFLIDWDVVQDIVKAANIVPGDRVLEIGPGIGTLTQGLAEAEADITAVEIDKKLLPVLKKTLKGYDNVRIKQGDILDTDIPLLMENKPFKTVANLPYYITTPILLELLSKRLQMTDIIAMVQKEVAERITAFPGTKDYGSLSVIMQYLTEPQIVLMVPPQSFYPAPEVYSVVIACHIRETPPVRVTDENLFFRLSRTAFGQRRKTLINALVGGGFPKNDIQKALEAAKIDPARRGETLSVEEFGALANAFVTLCPKD